MTLDLEALADALHAVYETEQSGIPEPPRRDYWQMMAREIAKEYAAREQTCGVLLGNGPAACQLPRSHAGYHEYVHTSPVKIENSQTNEEAFGFEPRW